MVRGRDPISPMPPKSMKGAHQTRANEPVQMGWKWVENRNLWPIDKIKCVFCAFKYVFQSRQYGFGDGLEQSHARISLKMLKSGVKFRRK